MITEHRLRVGLIYWDPANGFNRLLAEKLEALGCEVLLFRYRAILPLHLDLVLACGPFGSLVPLARQLLACPAHQRPAFGLWLTEQLPCPDLPEPVQYLGGALRSKFDRLLVRKQPDGEWRIDPRLEWLTDKGHRFRYYGDLYWLKQQGLLSVLIVSSPWIANYLQARGFDPLVVDLGLQFEPGIDLKLERDIPVLWIGKPGSRRRARVLRHIRAELRARGIEMMVIDGIEHPYVHGEERTVLLNRTKIALNILRQKWDDNSMRYYLAAPNRVLIVSEPTLPHTPFQPGVHLVEAPLHRLADTIQHYLSHEAERQQITEQAYQLVMHKLNTNEGVRQILERAVEFRPRPAFDQLGPRVVG
ncbi:MAG TPA: glycosyltransferase [Anaerolineae bacterium]|nr:glycosyltransferase [Anaerolineae bacterium]HMR63807.1 glycosyltransferase [Anaerolineae bacterium]